MPLIRASLLVLLALPTPTLAITAEEIDAAIYEGSNAPEEQSALTAKIQILLDREGISPGVIDGVTGGMSESAIKAFETREGMEADGLLDDEVWAALGGSEAGEVMMEHTITAEDLADVRGEDLPEDYSEQAQLDHLGYERASEAMAERFHMSEEFLIALNSGASFSEGETIVVADPGRAAEAIVARIEVNKQTSRLTTYDEAGAIITDYPVTIGSEENSSPSGTVEVVGVAPDPTYSYDPANFQQGDNTEPLELPPGPNGPVGVMWIDLSEPTYGLHGTPEPSTLFEKQSHGCVRLTNWDAEELAGLVEVGTTVEFIE